MSEKLTPQQHQAVYNRGGKLLVSAAAGSGKTKVLVDRLLTYLTDPADPANLDEFLIITYTKAAAMELRGKIASKLTEAIAASPENRHLQKQMQRLFLTKISTVHGFCSDILREYAYRLDLPADFRVADEPEVREIRNLVMKDLLDSAYENLGGDPDFLAFADSQGLGRDDRLVPEILEKVYDSARCHLDPKSWLEKCLEASVPEDAQDLGQTPWGSFLMADLSEYVSIQVGLFRDCAQKLEQTEGMEKPAANIASLVKQLETLRDAKTWDEILEKKAIDFGRLTFPRKNPDPVLSEQVKAVRTACKKGLERKLHSFSDPASQVIGDLQQSAAAVRGLIALADRFDRAFSAAKRSRRVLDFSDLEHLTLDLLLGKRRTAPTAAAGEIGSRFREVLVDEYQDSNAVQDAIFRALTQKRQNCFLVGDVKQSIYQFRLADPGIFLEKYHSYKPADSALDGEGRKVLLSHNFRSGPEVIEAVNDVFRACMRPKVGGLSYGEEEALREGVPRDPLPDTAVELYALEVQEQTYPEEAAFAAERIRRMLEDGTLIRKKNGLAPVKPEDIVILLRSPGSAARYFQQALEARGIRCTTGAGTDLLKTQEIAVLRAFLQTIMNPRQDIPLVSVLASPVFGFTADELAAIRSRQKKGCFYEAMLLSDSEKTGHFLEILEQLRMQSRLDTITALLAGCFRLTRLDSIFGAMPDGQLRTGNLQAFYQLAADYEKTGGKDLSQFLEYLASIEDKGLLLSGANSPDAVTIMSIHKSKGLEFPVVFLCNLSRRFNQENLRAQILCDKELGLGLSVADNHNRIRYPSAAKRAIAAKMAADSVSEELRVLYVAMTRARDRLVMTYASQSLEGDLKDLALRQDFDGGELLCREATCMGDWVLMAALGHTEAGELHALGDRPRETRMGTYPWRICLTQAEPVTAADAPGEENGWELPREELDLLRQGLLFRYPHRTATVSPSKQTATGRKGRQKDAEAAEKAPEPKKTERSWRRPSFASQGSGGVQYGTAVHTAMQYIDYRNCTSADGVREELGRLTAQRFLSREQAEQIRPEKLLNFFLSPIGRKLQQGCDHLREFKFSILDDGIHYDPALTGEKVLLQGVVDCALLEEDGITVIDFKTDYVTDMSLPQLVEHYRPQVQTYADALERIYEKKVKAKYIYFFRLDRFIEL